MVNRVNGIPIAKGPAHMERRTKIVATVGPASWDSGVLEQMIAAGTDVFRLNFSHAGPDKQAQTIETIRAAAESVGREVAVLGDLPGPKLRIGELRDDFAELETGMHVTLTPSDVEGDRERIPVPRPGVTGLRENQLVYLADGAIRLRVRDPDANGIGCEVEVGGTLSSHKGMNIPDGAALPAATANDLGWVEFAVEHGIDLLAVSFVSSAHDLVPVRERLAELGSDIPLIAKIERPQGGENIEEIVEAATAGIMVARGDLGIEVPLAEVPTLQKRLIRTAGKRSKPVDHRDPDARLDGHRAAPDPCRGDRRRQRDLRRHRRDHALRGDRRRPAPGRGGAGDGPDRPRDRARPALRRLAASRAPTRRARTSPTRSPRAPSAPPTGSASRRSSCRPRAAAPRG